MCFETRFNKKMKPQLCLFMNISTPHLLTSHLDFLYLQRSFIKCVFAMKPPPPPAAQWDKNLWRIYERQIIGWVEPKS